MDYAGEAESFLSLQELTVLFPLMKKSEEMLSAQERALLHKIEKILYRHLSVEEAEAMIMNLPRVYKA